MSRFCRVSRRAWVTVAAWSRRELLFLPEYFTEGEPLGVLEKVLERSQVND